MAWFVSRVDPAACIPKPKPLCPQCRYVHKQLLCKFSCIVASSTDPFDIHLTAVNPSRAVFFIGPPSISIFLVLFLLFISELADFSDGVLASRPSLLLPCHLSSCLRPLRSAIYMKRRQLARGRVHLTDAQLAVFCLTSQSNTFSYFCWEFGHTCLSCVRLELGS